MAVIGVAFAPAGRGRGRTATPRSSARVGNGSVRMAASTAPVSSAGTMSGNGMILTCTSRRVSPSFLRAWSKHPFHGGAAHVERDGLALQIGNAFDLLLPGSLANREVVLGVA